MITLQNIAAVFFDMDGTLVDSEPYTELAVHALCRECGVSETAVNCVNFDGGSWENIARDMVEQVPQLTRETNIANRLHTTFHHLLKNTPPPVIKGAKEAISRANSFLPVAIVSSSLRESIQETITQMNIEACVNFYVGAEDIQHAKPAPDCYLNAANKLHLQAQNCLVFEDSTTGLQAARNAGMQVVEIIGGKTAPSELSDYSIKDYTELADDFFERISQSG